APRHAAAVVARAVEERWPVSRPGDDDPVPRALRWGDVAVLIPTRTSLPPVEEAFEEVGIPYRLEGAALLWGSDDVHDVLCALAAVDEPSDAVSVLAALRSPGLGCGDDDLVSWAAGGGSWDPRAPAPEGLDGHAVARAMARLASLHRRRWWAEPSEMVRAAMDELRSYELAFAHRRPRDHWHRLRWLADQARLFDETSGGTLHEFLQWAELQRQGDGRASVLGPPDVDDDAVRVMTVHGSKGLEFPAVVLMGLEREDAAGQRPDAVLWDANGDPEVRAGLTLRSAGYVAADDDDRIADRLERVRLLYVATTRARDHLLLCLHHKEHRSRGETSHAAQLVGICRANPLLWRRLPSPEEEEAQAPPAQRRTSAAVPGAADTEIDLGTLQAGAETWVQELDRWAAQRAELLARLRRAPVVTATALAGATDDEGDPTHGAGEHVDALGAGTLRVSGAGLAIGRAVHTTLAAVDLATGRDPTGRDASELARLRAAGQGVAEHADEVGAMVQRALSSDVVRGAAGHRHYKEMYVSTALPGPADAVPSVLEGFVDLLVEDDDGLVIVDFKTDRLEGAAPGRAALAHYRRQIGAYAIAVEAATGRSVVRGVLLFLAGAQPLEVVLSGDELAEARETTLEAAERLLTTG
ncbi:MAG: 3'-5' exonuclease, partial [Acidimicrobiales bacterium]